MKTLEKGQDKIKKICSLLRDETLEPAKKQAEEIINDGKRQAEEIIAEARNQAEKIIEDARAAIKQEYNVFQSTLQQAAKQSVEALRQSIEHRFFNEHLQTLIEKNASGADIVAKLINAIIQALEKEGLSANLTALIPAALSPKEVNQLLLQDVLNKLKENTVGVGGFAAGAQVRLDNKRLMIDISEKPLKELLAGYVARKDFRKMIFAE